MITPSPPRLSDSGNEGVSLNMTKKFNKPLPLLSDSGTRGSCQKRLGKSLQ